MLIQRRLKFSLLMACGYLLLNNLAIAGDIFVHHVSSTLVNEIYLVDADLSYEFSDDALEAIASGITLFIHVDIKIQRKRRFLWDPKVLEFQQRYQIERHALSNSYILTNLTTSDRQIFSSIDAVVEALGDIHALPIAESASLDARYDYRAKLRARLDIRSLPSPLRPIAYISPAWRMSSKWYNWNLATADDAP